MYSWIPQQFESRLETFSERIKQASRLRAVIGSILFSFGLLLYFLEHNKSSTLDWFVSICFSGAGVTIFSLHIVFDSFFGTGQTALSKTPKYARGFAATTELVGLETDQEWLKGNGDKLLLGQPGTGKTSLLYKHCASGHIYFAKSTGKDELANAIRTRNPSSVIVDDCMANLAISDNLYEIRRDTNLNFQIILSAWPWDKNEIQTRYNLTDADTKDISRLTKDQIVEIIRSKFPSLRDVYIREIRRQSQGRPGLAITLTDLVRDDPSGVISGEAFAKIHFEKLPDAQQHESASVLAHFALGGNDGVALPGVSKRKNISPIDIRRTLTNLEAGGIVTQNVHDKYAIHPSVFRSWLIHKEFSGILDAEELLVLTNELGVTNQAIEEIINAAHYGYSISDEWIRIGLLKINDARIAKHYAYVSKDALDWAVQHFSVDFENFIEPALFRNPERYLVRILSIAESDTRETHQHPEHPLRQIEDWLCGAIRPTSDLIAMRRLLVRKTEEFLKQEGSRETAFDALRIAFTPKHERHESDPGSGYKITLIHGVIGPHAIKELRTLIDVYISLLGKYAPRNFESVISAIEDWAFPGRHLSKGIPDETYRYLREGVAEWIRKVAELFSNRPGVIRRLRETVIRADLGLSLPPNEEFEIIFPIEKLGDHENWFRARVDEAKVLGAEWAKLPADRILEKIQAFHNEAINCGIDYPTLWSPVANGISEAKIDIDELAILMLKDEKVPSDFRISILRHWIDRNRSAINMIADVMNSNWDANLAILLLESCTLPAPLVADCASVLSRKGMDIRFIIRNIPFENIEGLLRSADQRLRSQSAIGLWNRYKGSRIPETVHQAWRQAIIETTSIEYPLEKILAEDAQLAEDWIRASSDQYFREPRMRNAFEVITEKLSDTQRNNLIKELPNEFSSRDLVKALVAENPDHFSALLRSAVARDDVKLAPLHENTSDIWPALAKKALEHGYSEETVATYSLGTTHTWSDGKKYWSGKIAKYEKHRSSDNQLSRVIDLIIEDCESHLERENSWVDQELYDD